MNGSRHVLSVLTFATLSVLTFATLSCGGDAASGPEGPTPGTVTLVLEGAGSGDRAALLQVGAGATAVEAARTGLDVQVRPDRDGFVVAVFGPLADGALVRLAVSDTGDPPTVAVKEVAALDGTLKAPGAYRARLDAR